MSRSTIRNQILIQDGAGNRLPYQPGVATPTRWPSGYPVGIGTGAWVGPWINIDEHRRVNITLGIGSATGAAGDVGGFTGTLYVVGTDELAACNGATGTQEAGNTSRPGINGFTGARFVNPIPSGTLSVNASMTSLALSFTDVGAAFIRLQFNVGPTGAYLATGTLGGSGTLYAFLTAKNT